MQRPAQKVRSADWWRDGIAGRLVVMSAVAAGGIIYLADQIWGLDPAVKEAQKRAKEPADEYDRTNQEIDTNIGAIKIYAEELDKLVDKENKSYEDKDRIRFIVGQLNEMIPDLNLAYDEQADKLNKTSGEIDNYIESLERQLRIEAGRKYLKEIYEEQIRLQLELKKKKEEVTDADRKWYEEITKHAPGTKARNDALERYVEEMGVWSEKTKDYVNKSEAMARAEGYLTDKVERNARAIDGINKEIEKHGETAKSVLETIEVEVRKGGQEVGRGLGAGALEGLSEYEKQLYYEARRVTGNVLREMKKIAEIRSPSAKTKWMGKMIIGGLVEGMEDDMNDLLRTARSIPERTLAAMNQAQQEQLQRAVMNYSSPEVVQRLSVQVQAERPIQRIINVERMEVRNDADIEKVAAQLHELERRDMRGMGVRQWV